MAKRVKSFLVNDEVLRGLSQKDKNRITKVREIISNGEYISPKIKQELEKIGLSLVFRGFNSHSKDEYIYLYRNSWFYSVGVANVNKAGRGMEFELSSAPKILR